MIKIVLLSLLLALSWTFKPCQPFGTRIFYGQAALGIPAQKLQIYFNTAQNCSKSYLQLVRQSGLERIECQTTSLRLSKNVNFYQTYIHKCKINTVDYEQVFYYNAYGWDSSSAASIPYSQQYIKLKIANITNPSRQISLIVLADWSKLQVNLKKYKPLDKELESVLSSKQINGLLINGDIGYDLDTNNCKNYESFLVMLSKTSATIPVIIATGNHQYNTNDNFQLFSKSFELYKLDLELASALHLGPLYLLMFDPYQLLYNNKADPTIKKFTQLLSHDKTANKFIVPSSHYPLACSGTSKNCKNDLKNLKAYWQAMHQSKVSLYLGAHYHTYQRLYPYLKDGTFSNQKDHYKAESGYIISIVEGVAGNDKDIVETIDKIQSFTASYTVNETGFGVMTVGTKTVTYSHHSTAKGITDSIVIDRSTGSYNLMRE